jgi:hypothetical protein
MTLGSHITPLARSHIEKADLVFAAVSAGAMEVWLAKMNADVRSLQPYYREGKSRMQTYREMVDVMLAEVRGGKRVCGAFYGHPGVFAWPAHKAIERARSEGYSAHMEPGISAADCLYAELGIDPGRYGCQHYEASQFMLYRRRLDTGAYLILWQVGVAGDRSLARFSTGASHRRILTDVLGRDYGPAHEVIRSGSSCACWTHRSFRSSVRGAACVRRHRCLGSRGRRFRPRGRRARESRRISAACWR